MALLGAIFFKRLMTDAAFEPEASGALVDSVLGRAHENRAHSPAA
jgi:hypothetical protein